MHPRRSAGRRARAGRRVGRRRAFPGAPAPPDGAWGRSTWPRWPSSSACPPPPSATCSRVAAAGPPGGSARRPPAGCCSSARTTSGGCAGASPRPTPRCSALRRLRAERLVADEVASAVGFGLDELDRARIGLALQPAAGGPAGRAGPAAAHARSTTRTWSTSPRPRDPAALRTIAGCRLRRAAGPRAGRAVALLVVAAVPVLLLTRAVLVRLPEPAEPEGKTPYRELAHPRFVLTCTALAAVAAAAGRPHPADRDVAAVVGPVRAGPACWSPSTPGRPGCPLGLTRAVWVLAAGRRCRPRSSAGLPLLVRAAVGAGASRAALPAALAAEPRRRWASATSGWRPVLGAAARGRRLVDAPRGPAAGQPGRRRWSGSCWRCAAGRARSPTRRRCWPAPSWPAGVRALSG